MKIETVIEQFRAADTPELEAALLTVVSKSGLAVKKVSVAELVPDTNNETSRTDVHQLVKNNLANTVPATIREASKDGRGDLLVVGTGDGRALAFQLAEGPPEPWFTDKQMEITLKVVLVVLPVLLLSLCVSTLITAPLLKFAEAAEALKPNGGPDRPFEEAGTVEIRTLAKSLNDMRSRVRRMMDDRTRMLRAISHDLRTPLTRLRLRTERSTQPELKALLLVDIAALSAMIDDALTYLGAEQEAGEDVNADLPSLLETISSDFSDMGYNVTYSGPPRFTYKCRPRWLARAVTNVVENSTKFAQEAVITLTVHEDGSVLINVSDDGPGLPVNLHTRVLEPFFKVESARTTSGRTGFGLGLSIVEEIVRGHGGTVQILNSVPRGLSTNISLPAMGAQRSDSALLPSVAGA
jgi:signal transduction histidine kinase